MGKPDRKWKWCKESRRILGRRKLTPPTPAQITEAAGCDLPQLIKVLSHMANIDHNNGLI